ncbi:MAG: recombination protein NinB [Mariniphaga sp.]|nr:recombination protein NinB [Paludibacter sp.]MDD4225977.1 recombination protein NinB [Mariniphaga sp.]
MPEIELTYYGKVENGRMRIANRKQMDADIRCYEGKRISVTIRRVYKRRSDNQNKFLHGAVFPIARTAFYDTGLLLTLEEVKDYFKAKFLQYDLVSEHGEIFEGMVKPTHKLSTTEMEEFIENIRIWCRENLNCEIPLPNEQTSIAFK